MSTALKRALLVVAIAITLAACKNPSTVAPYERMPSGWGP